MEYLTYNTYAEHMKAAEHFLSLAKLESTGRRWNIVGTIAFAAFTIEAFINHVGATLYSSWDEWDSKNRPNNEEKLEKLDIELSKDMKTTFSELFKLRDIIVHGKTITEQKNVRKAQNNLKGAMGNLSSSFESRTTLNKACNLILESKDIISHINTNTISLSNQKLWSIGNGLVRTKI